MKYPESDYYLQQKNLTVTESFERSGVHCCMESDDIPKTAQLQRASVLSAPWWALAFESATFSFVNSLGWRGEEQIQNKNGQK